jgi:hypothetical protein
LLPHVHYCHVNKKLKQINKRKDKKEGAEEIGHNLVRKWHEEVTTLILYRM